MKKMKTFLKKNLGNMLVIVAGALVLFYAFNERKIDTLPDFDFVSNTLIVDTEQLVSEYNNHNQDTGTNPVIHYLDYTVPWSEVSKKGEFSTFEISTLQVSDPSNAIKAIEIITQSWIRVNAKNLLKYSENAGTLMLKDVYSMYLVSLEELENKLYLNEKGYDLLMFISDEKGNIVEEQIFKLKFVY